MRDQQLLLITLFFTLFTLGIFIRSLKKDSTNLINGVLFNFFILLLTLAIVISGSLYDNFFLKVLFIIVVSLYFLIGALGMTVLIIGLFLNSRSVLKKERRSISNLLTLFLGISLLLFIIVKNFRERTTSLTLKYLLIYCGIIITYFGLSFYNFIIVSVFNNFHKPKLNKDYIIVLGSGLIDGHKVSKLLGGRIDKAIEFYQLQKDNNKDSKLIFSGGQGRDELISEGEAMAKYALDKGVLKDDIIIENKSTTTLENFKYSKEIMDKEKDSYKAVFSTSNYHVLRANIYAKKVGLNISGIGAKTALYFLPNAIIREYIAILVMRKKTYFIRVFIVTLVYILLVLANCYLKKII